MAIPGLLVEYLISGCIAFIWLLKLLDGTVNFELDEPVFLILLPIAYVVGMFIDVVAWTVTRPAKNLIRKKVLNRVSQDLNSEGKSFKIEEYETYWDEKVLIEMNYPSLSQDLKARSSRDRIARGTMINLIPIAILYWSQISIFGIIMFIMSIALWYYFEFYGRSAEIRAAYIVRTRKAV